MPIHTGAPNVVDVHTKLKYVTFQDKSGKKYPIVFPAVLAHVDISTAVRNASFGVSGGHLFPVSAGFVEIGEYNSERTITAVGSSVTLRLSSNSDDDRLLGNLLGDSYDGNF